MVRGQRGTGGHRHLPPSHSVARPSCLANQGTCSSATWLCVTIASLVASFLVGCGAPSISALRNVDAATAVRSFPSFPCATWEGDITSQEADGQLIWIVSWTAQSAESRVRDFYTSTLGRSGWQFELAPIRPLARRPYASRLAAVPVAGSGRNGDGCDSWCPRSPGAAIGLPQGKPSSTMSPCR